MKSTCHKTDLLGLCSQSKSTSQKWQAQTEYLAMRPQYIGHSAEFPKSVRYLQTVKHKSEAAESERPLHVTANSAFRRYEA